MGQRYFKKVCFKKWEAHYGTSHQVKARYYADIQPIIPVRPWFTEFTDSRKFFTTICRLRFNHCYSLYHLARIGIQSDDI
ncbi:hypothetical protein O3M35_005242 [Rhynocoris fuscipes]|uniref:Uncharacterized protein n=1 Tax=Rhynocoris fuscipes TaxID=488301 RepID=A0AAW1DIX1_9HEMI